MLFFLMWGLQFAEQSFSHRLYRLFVFHAHVEQNMFFTNSGKSLKHIRTCCTSRIKVNSKFLTQKSNKKQSEQPHSELQRG